MSGTNITILVHILCYSILRSEYQGTTWTILATPEAWIKKSGHSYARDVIKAQFVGYSFGFTNGQNQLWSGNLRFEEISVLYKRDENSFGFSVHKTMFWDTRFPSFKLGQSVLPFASRPIVKNWLKAFFTKIRRMQWTGPFGAQRKDLNNDCISLY